MTFGGSFRWFTQQELESFTSNDKETIIEMINAMIVKRRLEGAVARIDRQQSSG